MYNPRPELADFDFELGCDCTDSDEELGRLLSGRVRKRIKKRLFKATLGPLALAHKVTHGKHSPIRKAELKLQGVVGKILPFTKPFIKFHNMVSDKVYKGLEKVHIAKKGQTGLASKAVTASKGSLLSDAASAYGKSGVSVQGQSVDLKTLTTSPQSAAAQMAAGQILHGNAKSLLSPANASMLNLSSGFRTATLEQLMSKAHGGNAAASKVLAGLKR